MKIKSTCKHIALFFLLTGTAIGGEFTEYTGPGTWENFKELPHYDQWSWMYDDAQDIITDLNSGGNKYYFEYKKSGGSSHQLYVKRTSDDEIMGLWSAPNHATYILGEIFAFNLARALGNSNYATPGTTMVLTGKAKSKAYKAMDVDLSKIKKSSRACNKDTILSYMNSNQHFITGAYMAFTANEKPGDVPKLVDRKHAKRLDHNHFIAKFIHNDSERPTGKTVYLNKGKREDYMSYERGKNVIATSTDTELAKQLSFMTVVDALNSQRDRFGIYGANMNVMINKETGKFRIALVDNGGTADLPGTSSLYYFRGDFGKAVSRFERKVFDSVIALDEIINKGIDNKLFAFSTEEEAKIALGYEDNPGDGSGFKTPTTCFKKGKNRGHNFLFYSLKNRWDKKWKSFKVALDRVAKHMKKFENNDKSFFN